MTLHLSTRLRELDCVSPPPWRRRPRCHVKSRQFRCIAKRKRQCLFSPQVGSGHHWTAGWFPRRLLGLGSLSSLTTSHGKDYASLSTGENTPEHKLQSTNRPVTMICNQAPPLTTADTPTSTWDCLWLQTHIINNNNMILHLAHHWKNALLLYWQLLAENL